MGNGTQVCDHVFLDGYLLEREQIMEAYQMGLSALKKSFADQPLTEDKLQDTLFELETVLEQQVRVVFPTTVGN